MYKILIINIVSYIYTTHYPIIHVIHCFFIIFEKPIKTKTMKDILNINDLPNELNLPKTLYKIRSVSSDRDWNTFLSGKIYLPSPSTFNDLYDCNIPLQY